MGKLKLPKGCKYPDCFNCTQPDCILPDDVDLIGDCDIDLVREELLEERNKLLEELKAKGIKTRDSYEYHLISNKISYLNNRDKQRLRIKRMNDKRKRSP